MGCSKRWFRTQEEANAEIVRMQSIRNGSTSAYRAKHVETRSYLCPRCDRYHLTSQSQEVYRKFGRLARQQERVEV